MRADSDCVFWAHLFTPLLQTLHSLYHRSSPPPQILLTVTSRLDRAAKFEAAARETGWHIEEVAVNAAALTQASTSFLHTRIIRLKR